MQSLVDVNINVSKLPIDKTVKKIRDFIRDTKKKDWSKIPFTCMNQKIKIEVSIVAQQVK